MNPRNKGNGIRIPAKISWWHLIYVIILLLVVLFCVIVCLSRQSVSDAAMDNVSFASAIVSIVLAVVSIVVSLYATFSTYSNLGSMEQVNSSIRNSLRHLRNIRKIAQDNNNKLNKLTSDDIIKATPEEIAMNNAVEHSEEIISKEEVKDTDVHPEASGPSVSQTPISSASANRENTRENQSSKVDIVAEIEDKTFKKIKSIFGYSDMMRDYRLRGTRFPMIFDGVVQRSDGTLTLFDIKVSLYGNTALTPLLMMRRGITMLRENYDLGNSHIYIVLVFRDNDKAKFLSRYRNDLALRDTPYLTILYFNLDEL